MTENRTFHAGKVAPRADTTFKTCASEKRCHIAGLPGTYLKDDLSI